MSATDKTKVKRAPKRGHYDSKTIHAVLDKEYMCHIAFLHDEYPVVIPTLYGRDGDQLYIHGSMASRMLKDLEKGIEISLCVSRVNGLVLARSAFHHSLNYESVVVFGRATVLDSKIEKLKALECISEQVIAGRWKESREPNDKELKGTMVLKISLENASAKIRTGGPVDEKEDYNLPIWAGVLPLNQTYGELERDELLSNNIEVPQSALNLQGNLEG